MNPRLRAISVLFLGAFVAHSVSARLPDQVDVDFGVVSQGQNAQKSIVIKNEGTFPIEVTASSNRAEFKVPTTPSRIDPGQQRNINVTLQGSSPPGAYLGQVTVARKPLFPSSLLGAALNAATQAMASHSTALEFTVKAAITKVSSSPSSTDLGVLTAPLGPKTVNVAFKNEGPVPLVCSGAQGSSMPGVGSLTFSPASVTIAPGQQATLAVTFTAKTAAGKTFGVDGAARCQAGTATVGGGRFFVNGSFDVFIVAETDSGNGKTTAQVTNDAFSAFGTGIACGATGGGGTAFGGSTPVGPNQCGGVVGNGAQVTLTAAPDAGNVFKRWTVQSGSASSCNNSTAPTCTFTVTANTTLQAVYGAP